MLKLDILAIAAHPDDVELGCSGKIYIIVCYPSVQSFMSAFWLLYFMIKQCVIYKMQVFLVKIDL